MAELGWVRCTVDGELRYWETRDMEPLTLRVWSHNHGWYWEVVGRARRGTESSEVSARRAAMQAGCALLRAWLHRGELALEVMW